MLAADRAQKLGVHGDAEVYAICEHLGIDGNLVGSAVARTAESMWNALYGTRGGVPFGGACLPKDTSAFLQFVREQGLDHLMLEATIEVNQRLEQMVPAAASPDKIDEALEAAHVQPDAGDELAIELGGASKVSVFR